MLFSSTFQGVGEGAVLRGPLAGVKISRNAYNILFIKSGGKYLRDQTIHGRYVERTVKLSINLN